MSGRKSVSEEDLVDLHGKVAIVTGGNTGVGYATIQMLARKGAKVYMGARDQDRATEAITKLEEEGINDGSVHWLKLDLSDPRTAQSAGKEFLEKEQRLDILVNNAARGSFGPYKLTKDGLLDIMVVNHISHFAFTEALLSLMKTTAKEPNSDVRIVNVTSLAHSRVKPENYTTKEAFNKDYGESFNGYLDTYGNSKLANILHIKELQKRLKAESIPITCISAHPGAIKTTGSDKFLLTIPIFTSLVKNWIAPLFFGPWRKGAMTIGYAAAGKDVKDQREEWQGVYVLPYAAITKPSSYALDERLAKELYDTTEKILRDLGL
ncbi:NAD(P)-binding protein [Dendrothele bispora CBS 962.96]|uniref:NAD(P)-binding protein n=1 Tax=Dendrothele bispora (strain CBS 962.96) TaxID=1314807 RepID=A0A4S8MWG5_DENBC|nr:NAD(P)-binding protein [Dendrothele bispora CBS 962.96]